MPKTALLFGSTGMIGGYLLRELLDDPNYDMVCAFVRRPMTLQHPKLQTVITDFDALDAVRDRIKGDVLFCCLGTTTKNTPSKEGRRKVDYEIPVHLSVLAQANQVACMMVVSAVGASAGSSNFYLRNKGEMEEAVGKRKVEQIVFLRPSFLLGDRQEFRAGEGVFGTIFRWLSPLLVGGWSKYRSIHGLTVARAMKIVAGQTKGISVIHYNEIKRIVADKKQNL